MSRKKPAKKNDEAKSDGAENSDCATAEEQPVNISETETAEEKSLEEDVRAESLQPDDSIRNKAIQQEEEPSGEQE